MSDPHGDGLVVGGHEVVGDEVVGDEVVDELVRLATVATRSAYAPYSRFQVGAALLTGDGRFHTGANVENRSYPMSICAERTAVVRAVTERTAAPESAAPETVPLEIVAVAVVEGNGGPCAPCGGCRQVIAEFARPGAILIYRDGSGALRRVPIEEALPDARAFL